MSIDSKLRRESKGARRTRNAQARKGYHAARRTLRRISTRPIPDA